MPKSPLAGVDANLLVALGALLSEENVGRAARSVGLSASAMSHTLSRARELLNDPILIRTGRRMTPTARARSLAPVLTEALALLGRAIATPEPLDPAAERRTLTVAATDFSNEAVCAPLRKVLDQQAPAVDLVVLPFAATSPGEIAAGQVDMGLAAFGKIRSLHSREVLREPFVCILRKGHPALRKRWTAPVFAGLSHILISPRGRVPGAVDRALATRRLRRRVVYVSPTFHTAAGLVATSDLVLTCGARSAHAAARTLPLVILDPPLRVRENALGVFWHERQAHDPFLAWVRDRSVEIGAGAP
ncbi:MAG: LysR family transcriptional regulator, partial [Polyangiaceae bacterium]|nr:LysR family transcriptional regulator [Polyangiaceae bacterium]